LKFCSKEATQVECASDYDCEATGSTCNASKCTAPPVENDPEGEEEEETKDDSEEDDDDGGDSSNGYLINAFIGLICWMMI
jgi:hypothetical protein